MRVLVIITGFLISMIAFTPKESTAQRISVEGEEAVEYSVEINQGAYQSLVDRVGERGISGREFGEWVVKNSTIRKRPGRTKFADR